MNAVYDLKPVGLENTFVTIPKTEEEKQEALSRYVNQIQANNPRGWDIVKIGNGRKYKTKEGKELTSSVVNNAGRVSINFHEVFGKNDSEAANKRLMEVLGKENKSSNPNGKEDLNTKPLKNKSENKPSKKWWEFWK